MAGIRVLMVDDQPVILAALERMLGGEKEFDLHAVSDPALALQQALSFGPHVILQDLVMDGLDGIALLKRYRAHPNLTDVPVVMLSAAEEPQTKVEAFRCGANDYVVKLPSALELAARLRYHGRAFLNARQREQAFQALLESRAALEQRQAEIERQKSLLEVQAKQLESVNRELADSALSDALTGLRNRRFLRQYLEQDAQAFTKHAEERRRKPQGFALSYFLFDLDHFKQINDCFGHDAGDSVLVAVAQRIRQTLRTGDAAMRWGGEEFLIVARGLDLEGSQSLAARILEAVAAQPMTLPSGEPLWVSASLGYTPWPWSEVSDAPDAQVDEYHLAVSLADAATYLAKIGGRNRAYGVLPGRDTEFAHRLASLSLGPGTLREEDGRGVRLLSLLGPQRSDAARR